MKSNTLESGQGISDKSILYFSTNRDDLEKLMNYLGAQAQDPCVIFCSKFSEALSSVRTNKGINVVILDNSVGICDGCYFIQLVRSMGIRICVFCSDYKKTVAYICCRQKSVPVFTPETRPGLIDFIENKGKGFIRRTIDKFFAKDI